MKRLLLIIFLPVVVACSGGTGDVTLERKDLNFPDGFWWGTSTAAFQIEGNDTNVNWYRWAEMGRTEAKPGLASNGYKMYVTDTILMKDIHMNTYRFSIEWGRVEPAYGVWNTAAIEHYRDVIKTLIDNGIRPVVCLHHFTTPLWVEDPANLREYPGWISDFAVTAFLGFVKKMVEEYGDLVDYWMVFNEPNMFTMTGYWLGIGPPGYSDPFHFDHFFYPAMKNVIRAHREAYKIIHEYDTVDADGDGIAASVGVAQNMNYYAPVSDADTGAAERVRYLLNFVFVDGAMFGKVDFNLDGEYDYTFPTTDRTLDWIGVNYYSITPVVSFSDLDYLHAFPCISYYVMIGPERCRIPDAITTDMGWVIYPRGIYEVVKETYMRYHMPIYITENGLATRSGRLRGEFIVSHLYWLWRAIQDGMDVRGYLHWSLMDNYEWGSFFPRFGLYYVDYAHGYKRILTEGGKVYGEIAEKNAIPGFILEEYGDMFLHDVLKP